MKNMSSENLAKNLPIRMKRRTYDFLAEHEKNLRRPKAWIVREILEAVQEDEDLMKQILYPDAEKTKE